MKGKVIIYNPAVSVKQAAVDNGVSEATIRHYIKVNGIDRRLQRKQLIISECKSFLKKHPTANWCQVQQGTGHSLSTIRKYRDYINGKSKRNKLIDFNNKKIKIRQSVKENQFSILSSIPIDVIREYLVHLNNNIREEIESKPRGEKVLLFRGLPFLGDAPFENKNWDKGILIDPFEEFKIPVTDCIQFHSKALPENKVLSNHYDCIITFRGVEFYGVEQLYHALIYSQSPAIVKEIMACSSGKAAKTLCAKKYPKNKDCDFDEKRFRILSLCHFLKYLSVREFRDRLRKTVGKTLVECPNGQDRLCGMVQDLESNIFLGCNYSGRSIMLIRDIMIAKERFEMEYTNNCVSDMPPTPTETRKAWYGEILSQLESDPYIRRDCDALFAIINNEGISKLKKRRPIPMSVPVIDKKSHCLIVDFDDTLFDTSADDIYRKGRNKNIEKAFEMIPQYRLCDGWREVIEWCTSNGVKIAVLSGALTRLIETSLSYFNVPYEAIIGYQPYIQKPNAILGNMIQERLNVRNNQIMYVGNSKIDEVQARASQFRFVGATWLNSDNDYFREKGIETINNPKEIILILKKARWSQKKTIV